MKEFTRRYSWQPFWFLIFGFKFSNELWYNELKSGERQYYLVKLSVNTELEYSGAWILQLTLFYVGFTLAFNNNAIKDAIQKVDVMKTLRFYLWTVETFTFAIFNPRYQFSSKAWTMKCSRLHQLGIYLGILLIALSLGISLVFLGFCLRFLLTDTLNSLLAIAVSLYLINKFWLVLFAVSHTVRCQQEAERLRGTNEQ